MLLNKLKVLKSRGLLGSARVVRAGDALHGRRVQSQQRSQVRLIPLVHHLLGGGPRAVHGAAGLAAEPVLLQECELCGGLVAGVLLPPSSLRVHAAVSL